MAHRNGSLASGMYPTVQWPVRRPGTSLFVPNTSVVTTTGRAFVVRNHDGHAQWVVSGNLKAGDRLARRATGELREGTASGGRR